MASGGFQRSRDLETRQLNEGTDRFLARLLGNPTMVRLEERQEGAGPHDVYVGTVNPDNPVRVVAVTEIGAGGAQTGLSDLRWSTIHFLDPSRSRFGVNTEPSVIDVHTLDSIRVPSVVADERFSYEREGKREYMIETPAGERPMRATLVGRKEEGGVSGLCSSVSMYTLVQSKNSFIERE